MDTLEQVEVLEQFRYVGSELDLAAGAVAWKTYWSSKLAKYIYGDTLEVGAGLGSNTPFMRKKCMDGRWVCLEPDSGLLGRLRENLQLSGLAHDCESRCGTLRSIPNREKFDTIIYIDVLEHIEDDAAEMQLAAERLKPGGRIVVLAPAYQFLYTAFDLEIGHFRRYSRSLLRSASPAGLEMEALFNLDVCGIGASAMNKLLLCQALPTQFQLTMWDRLLVPLSRLIDPLFGFTLGKSVVGVWRKPNDENLLSSVSVG